MVRNILRFAALAFLAATGSAAAQEAVVPFPADTGTATAEGMAHARRFQPFLASTGGERSGFLFELHGRYYQIFGRSNIFSPDPRYDAARRRLYEVFKQEWSGYQGVLRTNAYAANDGLAHLVAGKQIELLSDEQIRVLVIKHLPHEAPALLPPGSISASEAVAANAAGRVTSAPATAVAASGERGGLAAAVEAVGLTELFGLGAVGLGAIAASGVAIWWFWPKISALAFSLAH